MVKSLETKFYDWIRNELVKHTGIKTIISFDTAPLSAAGNTSRRFLTTISDNKSAQRFVVKRYQIPGQSEAESINQAQREYLALLHLKSVSSALWSTPDPISFSEEYATLIMSFCPGYNVGEIFWNSIKWPFLSFQNKSEIKEIINHVALIIKDMQSMEDCDDLFPESSPLLSGKFFQKLIDSLQEKGVDGKMLIDAQQRVENNLDAIMALENRSFQHTDLYFNNIIYDRARYFILDFPNACYGSRYWDISHMIVSLEDFKIFRNVAGKAIDNFKESFLEHFNVDASLLKTMTLFHYCFSFNIRTNYSIPAYKKMLMKDVQLFYESRIRTILNDGK